MRKSATLRHRFTVASGYLLIIVALGLANGCNEGKEASSPVAPVWSLSPTLSQLSVSGNSLSQLEGGILKLSCRWTSSEVVTSATAYLAFVEELNSPTLGPQGIISSDTTASATTATVSLLVLPVTITQQTVATTTTATTTTTTTTTTATSTATTTTTTATTTSTTTPGTASAAPWLFSSSFDNPLAISTGIATRELSGLWTVEIPFPASAIASATPGKQQMLLWMIINQKKTNTLAFEITIAG